MESSLVIRLERVSGEQEVLHWDKVILLKTHHWDQKLGTGCQALTCSVLVFGVEEANPPHVRLYMRLVTDVAPTEEKAKLLPETEPLLPEEPIWHLQRTLGTLIAEIVRNPLQTLLQMWEMPEEKGIRMP